MTPAYQSQYMGTLAKVFLGDCRDTLRQLPEASVHCVVTSPPYYGLRDYGVEGQIGLEKTHLDYVDRMVDVFREVWRVLRDDGVMWLNLGDSYAGSWGAQSRGECSTISARTPGIKRKELMGIPWRVAFALQDAGWYLRSEVIWHKPNSMPESVRTRPSRAHETVFLFAKHHEYYFDSLAIQEPAIVGSKGSAFHTGKTAKHQLGRSSTLVREEAEMRSKRTVWTIPTQPTKEAHFATFPYALVTPCIQSGSSEHGCCSSCGAPFERDLLRTRVPTRPGRDTKVTGDRAVEGLRDPLRHVTKVQTLGWKPTCGCAAADVVPCTILDPFSGSGTTGIVSLMNCRNYIGCELNPEYIPVTENRFAKQFGPATLFYDWVKDDLRVDKT